MKRSNRSTWTFLVLVSTCVIQATIVTIKFTKLKPEQNITGNIGAVCQTRSQQQCALKCLTENNCFLYQYKGAGYENCILILKNSSKTEEHKFEDDDNGVFYEKVSESTSAVTKNSSCNVNTPEPSLYLKFDSSASSVVMEGSQKLNFVPLVTGKVNFALRLDHTKRQWVDLGIHTEVCMTRPDACGVAGGAISLWINADLLGGGLISSRTQASSGLSVFGFFGTIWFEVILREIRFDVSHLVAPTGWTHVVLNYVGPNDGEGIRLYEDGTEVQSASEAFEESHSAGDGRIVVGRTHTNQDQGYASAQVDELMYFNQALSIEDIHTLYTDQ